MIAHELNRRFGDSVTVTYLDASSSDVRAEHSEIIASIEAKGLLYPVTLIDGAPRFEGSVSYPSIMRIVTEKVADLGH
ncbi:MAG: DUF1462 family protein [Actinobacteria bacterium]|nr:DUF1462 family protein [Actinomycetota bacterium]MCL5887371.1 DUF1462 family protein [Actinomycetota bacterium]